MVIKKMVLSGRLRLPRAGILKMSINLIEDITKIPTSQNYGFGQFMLASTHNSCVRPVLTQLAGPSLPCLG